MNKSFTLIELLIVIGILAILVVTILITLNPSEAQKKARDAKRMKDLATLQAIVLQWINDGNPPFCTSLCEGNNIQAPNSQPCNTNWLGVNVCQYSNSVPSDPINGQSAQLYYGNPQSPQSVVAPIRYRLMMSGSDWKIGVLQESKTNAKNTGTGLPGDPDPVWVEVASSTDAMNLW